LIGDLEIVRCRIAGHVGIETSTRQASPLGGSFRWTPPWCNWWRSAAQRRNPRSALIRACGRSLPKRPPSPPISLLAP